VPAFEGSSQKIIVLVGNEKFGMGFLSRGFKELGLSSYI
jgi:hypothetical protein